MMSMRRFGIIFLNFILPLISFTVNADVPGVDFEGPKVTESFEDDGLTTQIAIPGDFEVYNFVGGDPLDVVVPIFRNVAGLENKMTWGLAGPNTFFNGDKIGSPLVKPQVVRGDFNNNGVSDLAILIFGNHEIQICFDYNQKCAGGLETANLDIELFAEPSEGNIPLEPIAAVVRDFDGDGDDDLAVTSINNDTKQGYVHAFMNSGGGGVGNPFVSPYTSQMVPNVWTWSIAAGDFNNDGREDVVVGGPSIDNYKEGNLAVLHSTANPANPLQLVPLNQYTRFNRTCNVPTGLKPTDPNGDGFEDLVVTCAFMVVEDMGVDVARGGPVLLTRNQGGQFVVEQTVTKSGQPGLELPVRSDVCDFNGDGKQDLVVANWAATEVLVYEGTGDYKVKAESPEVLDAAPYRPTFIQCADMNADGREDIVTVSRSDYTNFWTYQYQAGEEITNGIPISLYVTPDTALSAQGQTLMVTQQTLSAASGNASAVLPVSQTTRSAVTPNLRVVANPGAAVQSPSVRALLVDREPRYNSPIRMLQANEILFRDGVLVYLNTDEAIVDFGPVECDSQGISFSCEPAPGKTLVSCIATSDETGGMVEAEAPTWSDTFPVPASPKVFKVKVIATHDDGSNFSAEIDVNLESCPSGGGSACPEQPIEKHVMDQEYFNFCVSDGFSKNAVLDNATIQWRQVGGPEFLGLVKGSEYEYKNINVGGPCIDGVFKSQNWFTTTGYDLEYRTMGVGGEAGSWCPAKLIHTAPGVEGSGTCSLNNQLRATPRSLGIMLLLGLTPLVLSLSRKRFKRSQATID